MIHQQIFDAVLADALPDSDPTKHPSLLAADLVTNMVNILRKRSTFPDPEINKLMGLAWELIGNKITATAASPETTRVHFFYEKAGDKEQVYIIVPLAWGMPIPLNPVTQLRELVWAASQARDYWNGKILPGTDKEILKRAEAYEAQLLLSLRKVATYEPDASAQALLKRFPNGIHSASELTYEGKQYKGQC